MIKRFVKYGILAIICSLAFALSAHSMNVAEVVDNNAVPSAVGSITDNSDKANNSIQPTDTPAQAVSVLSSVQVPISQIETHTKYRFFNYTCSIPDRSSFSKPIYALATGATNAYYRAKIYSCVTQFYIYTLRKIVI